MAHLLMYMNRVNYAWFIRDWTFYNVCVQSFSGINFLKVPGQFDLFGGNSTHPVSVHNLYTLIHVEGIIL